MALIPELNVVESTASCCGIAGTYGLKREKYGIAMDVGANLFRQVAENRSDEVVCDSETCRWQISAGDEACHSVHPVEMLHRASARGSSDGWSTSSSSRTARGWPTAWPSSRPRWAAARC